MSKQLVMATASGEQHGLVNTLTNSVPFDDFKHMQPQHKKELEKQKKEDSRIVKAEYMNSRGRHERLTKPYCRYAGDPIHVFHLIPGKVYELPVGFINEVNDKNRIMKKREGLVSVDGNPVQNTEAPLGKDEDGDWLHKVVPVAFG
jgi:hypothetical protein